MRAAADVKPAAADVRPAITAAVDDVERESVYDDDGEYKS